MNVLYYEQYSGRNPNNNFARKLKFQENPVVSMDVYEYLHLDGYGYARNLQKQTVRKIKLKGVIILNNFRNSSQKYSHYLRARNKF